MEVQESFWSARERTVIAKMERYLDKSDDVRVEFRELGAPHVPRRLGCQSNVNVHLDEGKQEGHQKIRDLQYKWK